MAKVERGFHSLAKIESASLIDQPPRVTFDLKLPGIVPTERIGIHLRRLHRMMNMGGINRLQVTGHSGPLDRQQPIISGVAGEGVATAEGVFDKHTLKSGSQRRRPSSNDQSPYLAGRWVDVTLPINITDVADRIGRKQQRIRDPKAWATELNQDIKDGIVQEGIEHLIFNLSLEDKFDMGYVGLVSVAMGSSLAIGVGEFKYIVPSIILSTFFGSAGANFTNGIDHYRKKYDNDFRRSLFIGPQIDRALVLSTMSRQRIIK